MSLLVWMRDQVHQVALEPQNWVAEPPRDQLAFYVNDFSLTKDKPWLTGATITAQGSKTPLPALIDLESPKFAPFREVHQLILDAITRGQLQKMVPWVSYAINFAENLDASMWLADESVPDRQTQYGFYFQDEGMAGVTPETLFSVQNGVLTTMALAGTGPIAGGDLRQDNKEVREHEMVIDDLREALADLGTVEVGTTHERPFALLKHLCTPLSVRLHNPVTFGELVHRLHPTAALGGRPRSAALEFMRRYTPLTQRGLFGAPFGWQNGQEMKCVVAIRGIQWRKSNAQLMVGCGVVRGSQAEKEWAELQLKRDATLRQLGILWP